MKYFLCFLFFCNYNLLAESAVKEITLTANQKSYQEDRPLMLTVNFKLQPDWHIYYKVPGKFGLPTELTLKSESSLQQKEWIYPAAQEFKELTGDVTYGYEGEVNFKIEIIPEYNFKRNLGLSVLVNWLACNDSLCVPGEQVLKLTLPYVR